jgi:hypothetical protein
MMPDTHYALYHFFLRRQAKVMRENGSFWCQWVDPRGGVMNCRIYGSDDMWKPVLRYWIGEEL